MIALWNNPELIRNARSQLRPGKMLATACIAAAISLAIGFAFSHQGNAPAGLYGWGRQLLALVLGMQALVLAAGGGIACVNTIFREKEQNTFDFQRVTRLTPLEFTLGKLFGAPIFTYFVTLCLMPLSIFSALVAKMDLSIFAAIYVVLLVASLMIHSLALLISLLAVRGAHTGAILFLLLILGATSGNGLNTLFFQLGPLGPFFSIQMTRWESWGTPPAYIDRMDFGGSHTDVFFGQTVPHVPVLLILDAIFIAWFLLALVRNIKRDSNYYEIYSPLQALAFALYLNLLFIGFFRWHQFPPIDDQSYLLTINMGVFFCFGLVVLRNRERFRRILRTRQNQGTSLIDFCWPAPLLLVGAVSAGLIVVLGVTKGWNTNAQWNVNLSIFRSVFFAVFVARDIQFLQWMSLRRGKHPLVMGMLFQIIFYVCALITLSAFSVFRVAEATPFSAFFVPSPVYLLEHDAWALRPAIWAAAFVAQLVLIAMFAGLQRRAIEELEVSAAAPSAAPAIAQT